MPGLSGTTDLYEDQTVATAGGTYATGGIKFTATKVAALLSGTLEFVGLGTGFVITPVQGSELGQTATMQFWQQNGATGALAELSNGSTLSIGVKFRASYQGT